MSRRMFFGAMVVVAVLTASATVVLASHQFPDVPNSNPFHDEISAMADAGITTGYGNGNFGPTDNVTRQAMAAFLGRGLSRVAHDENVAGLTVTTDDGGYTSEESVTLTAGAEGSGNGFAFVTATFATYTFSEENCPCEMQFRVRDAFNGAVSGTAYEQLDNNPSEAGAAFATSTVTEVFVMGAGETHTFHADALVDDANATNVQANVQLTAVYVPFGGSLSGAAVGIDDSAAVGGEYPKP